MQSRKKNWNRVVSWILTIVLFVTCMPSMGNAEVLVGGEDYRAWEQTDSRWGNIRMGNSPYNVASIGCLVTSISKLLIQSGLKDQSTFNVATLVNWLNQNSGFTASGGLYWAKIQQYEPQFQYQNYLLNGSVCSSANYNEILFEWINQGYHIVLEVRNKTHWVAIDEARTLATGIVYIMDSLMGVQNVGITLAERYSTFTRVVAYKGGTEIVCPHSSYESVVDEEKEMIRYTCIECGDTYEKAIEYKVYEDVLDTQWYYKTIQSMAKLGFMTGTSDTTFEPESSMTRAMVVSVLYRMAGKPKMTYEERFTDVKEGQWYTTSVIWAATNKIVSGYDTDGTFRPMDNITREQVAVIIRNYMKSLGMDTSTVDDLSKFKDSEKVSNWAKSAIGWAVEAGIMSGTTDGYINPQDNATRAECAKMLLKAYEMIEARLLQS